MLEPEVTMHGTGGSISRALLDKIKDAPRCEVCKVEPVAATLTVCRMTGEVTKQLDVCHECLIKEM